LGPDHVGDAHGHVVDHVRGSGSSQVGVAAAMRARDAARPTDEDLAEAEAHVQIVRRNWTPREDLPRR
ncbi:hypothetical protein AB0I76_29660, partial [Micromonospora sp. NPDC049799]